MMDYKKILDALIEQIGEAELGRIIVEKDCPHSYHLSDTKGCGSSSQNCYKCWAKAVGLKLEVEKS
jgi:hypothetical protein